MFSWINFLSYAIITAVTPGPNNIMSMTTAGQKGFKRSLPFTFGIWVGFSIVMILCTLFCSLFSTLIPKVKLPMMVIGAIYMLYLAWKTFNSSGNIEERSSRGSFLSGLGLQFVNPKIIIYGIVSMEVYILPYYSGHTAILIGFALLLALIGFVFTLSWAGFGSVFKLLFSKYARITNTIMAVLLLYCAISLFL